MVRVGGLSYECAPKEVMGNRIQNMVFSSTGAPVESDKSYAVEDGRLSILTLKVQQFMICLKTIFHVKVSSPRLVQAP